MTGIKRERENEGSNLPRNSKKTRRSIHEFNGNSMKMEERTDVKISSFA